MGFGGREVKDQRDAGSVSGSGCGRVGLDYRAVWPHFTGPVHGTAVLTVALALLLSVCHGVEDGWRGCAVLVGCTAGFVSEPALNRTALSFR